jgi:hypothetical protein
MRTIYHIFATCASPSLHIDIALDIAVATLARDFIYACASLRAALLLSIVVHTSLENLPLFVRHTSRIRFRSHRHTYYSRLHSASMRSSHCMLRLEQCTAMDAPRCVQGRSVRMADVLQKRWQSLDPVCHISFTIPCSDDLVIRIEEREVITSSGLSRVRACLRCFH